MVFPPFGVKEILANLAAGYGRQMNAWDDQKRFPDVEDGSVIVEVVTEDGDWLVIVSPSPYRQSAPAGLAKFAAFDRQGREFCLAINGEWLQI